MKELKEPFSVADICRFSIVARNACIEFQKNEDTDNKSNDMMSDIKEYAHNLDKTLQLYYDEPEEMCDEGVLKKEQEAFNRFFKTIGIDPTGCNEVVRRARNCDMRLIVKSLYFFQ